MVIASPNMKNSDNSGGDDDDDGLGNPLSIHERTDPSRAICSTKPRVGRTWRKFAGVITNHQESVSSPTRNDRYHGFGGTMNNGGGIGGNPSYVRLVPFTASTSTPSRLDDDADSRSRSRTLSVEQRKCPSISVWSTRPGGIRRRKGSSRGWRVMGNVNNDIKKKSSSESPFSGSMDVNDKIPLVLDTTKLSDSRNDEEISTLDHAEKEQKPEAGTILVSSYSYYLVSGNRQISYDEFSGKNPYKSMNIIDYDIFPVYVGSDRCLIKVEASSVSYFDCIIRQGQWRGDIQRHPNVPGFDAVGEVMAAGPDAIFSVGDKVATVLRRGGNSRFAVASNLVKINEFENVHHVCGLLSTYVAAFQMLHTGDEDMAEATTRYLHDYLRGQVVFINGGMSGFGQAAIHLAKLFGAQTVYATSRGKDFDHLRELGSVPLHLGSTDEMKNLVNSVDLVIDMTTYVNNDIEMFNHLAGMRKLSTGRLVFNVHGDIARNGKHGIRTHYDLLQLRSKILLLSNVYLFDHLDPTTRRRYFRNDFAYLRKQACLRGKDRLRVKVVATLSLDEVPHAHYKLGNSNVRGVITCDPWL